jgi:hypothetical protein
MEPTLRRRRGQRGGVAEPVDNPNAMWITQDAAAAGALEDDDELDELDELDEELSFAPPDDEPDSDLVDSLLAESLLPESFEAVTPPPPERLSVR